MDKIFEKFTGIFKGTEVGKGETLADCEKNIAQSGSFGSLYAAIFSAEKKMPHTYLIDPRNNFRADRLISHVIMPIKNRCVEFLRKKKRLPTNEELGELYSLENLPENLGIRGKTEQLLRQFEARNLEVADNWDDLLDILYIQDTWPNGSENIASIDIESEIKAARKLIEEDEDFKAGVKSFKDLEKSTYLSNVPNLGVNGLRRIVSKIIWKNIQSQRDFRKGTEDIRAQQKL